MNKISIVIPVLNEVESIVPLIKHLISNSTPENISELIIVDGGSTDGSVDLIKGFINETGNSELSNYTITLVSSAKGRAKQMNAGAKNANGDILYFLHADAFPPEGFDRLIKKEIEKGNFAGCFRMQFQSDHWWLRLASWLTQFRWRACRGGDQSQFITSKLFDDIGGYDERYKIYEDNILINELYARKQFVVIQDKIKTSTRSYDRNGIWRLQYHFWAIYVKKWFGASADELHSYYKKHIH